MNNSTPWWAFVVWLLTVMVVYVARTAGGFAGGL